MVNATIKFIEATKRLNNNRWRYRKENEGESNSGEEISDEGGSLIVRGKSSAKWRRRKGFRMVVGAKRRSNWWRIAHHIELADV